jgi:hypothetical protein
MPKLRNRVQAVHALFDSGQFPECVSQAELAVDAFPVLEDNLVSLERSRANSRCPNSDLFSISDEVVGRIAEEDFSFLGARTRINWNVVLLNNWPAKDGRCSISDAVSPDVAT